MANKQSAIKYKGEEYELVFNLNVMEIIQEKYETVEAWGNLVEATEEPKAKDIKFGFTAMLNEGVDIYNEDHEGEEGFKPRKPFSERQVGRIITEIGLAEAARALNDKVVESTKSDEKN